MGRPETFQNLIISNDQKLINACPDEDVRKHLQNMLEDDQKNLGIREAAIVQYGIQAEPSAATKIFIPQSEQMMSGDEFRYYQKLIYHELMKHGQAMSGIVGKEKFRVLVSGSGNRVDCASQYISI